MCGTCGCRDAESFNAPIVPMDDICLSCSINPPTYNSNLCKKCQKDMGVKKLTERQAAMFRAEPDAECITCASDMSDQPLWGCECCGMLVGTKGEHEGCGFNEEGEVMCNLCYTGQCDCESFEGENFGAEGDASKTTSSHNAKFFVGFESKGELIGRGKYMKYNDAVAKAKQVADKEGHARVVSSSGLAMWTHDGKGLFQSGSATAEAKKFYRAEDGSVDMNAYANDYMAAEEGFFEAESTGSRFPWMTIALLGLGALGVSRIKKVEFKADCGCGCAGDCTDTKDAQGYPEVYDPVADFLPRYRYPADSVWSNDYNPADPYRPLDYQTVHTDSNTKAKRM